ncbi:hypothetical protein [Sphingobium mellinum]|uniref:hypothetical protein n=1 Tax=Sphingobium mellinum TaxID=1387166 RepID=UPI0030EEB593
MVILFLTSMIGAGAPAAPVRDIQQVAIDAITGASRQAPVARYVSAEDRAPIDPQSEIVDRITGRNIAYPAPSGRADIAGDPQAAIVRAITGRK